MLSQYKKILLILNIIFLIFSSGITYSKIKVVAAENFYANVADLIGGEYVTTNSIINNPDADPHLFSTSANTSVALHDAQIIIYNGINYDIWMNPLIKSSDNNEAIIIDVSQLMQSTMGDNPHLWYNPNTFPMLAKELTLLFGKLDPEHKSQFESNYKRFIKRYQNIYDQINDIRMHYEGVKVTATEPVFGYMSDALGFTMLGEEFQWAVMNDSETSPKMLANYQNLLKQRKVQILFFNYQVYDNVTESILRLAKENDIPNVGVSETMPQKDDVITWFSSNLYALKKVLEQITNNNQFSSCVIENPF